MSDGHEFWPWYNSHVQDCNFMLCVLLNYRLLVLTSRYLISSMPKIASIASFMFSWTAALAQGKTLFQGGFNFCWKKIIWSDHLIPFTLLLLLPTMCRQCRMVLPTSPLSRTGTQPLYCCFSSGKEVKADFVGCPSHGSDLSLWLNDPSAQLGQPKAAKMSGWVRWK